MQTTPCHCGAVSITIPDLPGRRPTANFSICRRYGVPWADDEARNVAVPSRPATGRRSLRAPAAPPAAA